MILAVLVVLSYVIGSKIAREAAVQEARLRGVTIADTVAAPLVDDRVRNGEPAALRQLGRVMRARMTDGSLTHVKLWNAQGTILWSDERELIGKNFPLEQAERELFGTHRTVASVSNLDRAENASERSEGELLEVYAGTVDADGLPLVFEAYLSTTPMHEAERRTMLYILPLAIGGLLLFQLTVLPLAVSLARRVQRAEADRTRIVQHALRSGAVERRRIAASLHDGVIQDLAGVTYAMPEVRAHLPDTPEAAGAREAAARAVEILRRDVASLRATMMEIYPPDLHGPGFVDAMEDLAREARERGLEVDLRIHDPYQETVDASRLAYRIAREGLRNVVEHARATWASVEVDRRDGHVYVAVRDDGLGVSETHTRVEGHLGLVLLEDTLRDFHGQISVRPMPEGGTLLEAQFPADLLDVLPDDP